MLLLGFHGNGWCFFLIPHRKEERSICMFLGDCGKVLLYSSIKQLPLYPGTERQSYWVRWEAQQNKNIQETLSFTLTRKAGLFNHRQQLHLKTVEYFCLLGGRDCRTRFSACFPTHTQKKKLSASYNFLEPIIKVSEEGDSYKFNREAEDAESRSGEKQKSQK